jgi:chorismate mutase
MTKLHPIVRLDVCALDSAVSRRRLLLAGAAALILTRSAAAAPLAGEDPLMTLIGLMRQRLDLIVAVARSKWNTGSSVEDLAREKTLADDVAGLAPRYGLNPQLAAMFFRAQIEEGGTKRDHTKRGRTQDNQQHSPIAPLHVPFRPVTSLPYGCRTEGEHQWPARSAMLVSNSNQIV